MSKESRKRQKERQKLKKVNSMGKSKGLDIQDKTPQNAFKVMEMRRLAEKVGWCSDNIDELDFIRL